jgi:integrase
MRSVLLKVIQDLMGHATIDMMMRYAHLGAERRPGFSTASLLRCATEV